ncbi:MAG: PH domain-containing protein [Candidatus Heimdallarchaeaceae archaeon]
MICEFCGALNDSGDLFCSKCGKPLPKAESSLESVSDEPLMVLKPTFVLWGNIGGLIIITLFLTLWCAGFFGMIISSIIAAVSDDFGFNFIPIIVIAILTFFGFPIFYKYTKKKAYSKTEYRIYSDRIDYYEGFFTINRKTVLFSNVTQVSMSERLYQQKHNLGTILLSTPALSSMKGYSSGVKIKDIQSPEKVYKKLREIIATETEDE